MPLAGYQPPTRTVKIDEHNSFDVRGLGFNDVAVLIREHFPDLEALAGLFVNEEPLEMDNLMPLAQSLISNAPGFVANVIALAAGEGDASDAERLPASVQLQALFDIGDLTFTEVGSVKKAMGLVAAAWKNPKVKHLTKRPTRS